jgi:hypothetical protein
VGGEGGEDPALDFLESDEEADLAEIERVGIARPREPALRYIW